LSGLIRAAGLIGFTGVSRLFADDELSPELQLLKNIQHELVERCLYRLETDQILAGGLHALSKEVGPQFSDCFPKEDLHEVGALVEAYQKMFAAVLAHPSARDAGWSPASLVEKAMVAYVRTLDPFSSYIDSASAQVFHRTEDAEYASAGMETRWKDGRVFCHPYESFSAERAGVEQGDELLEVDGWLVSGHSVWEVTRRLRAGGPGSKISIKVLRGGSVEKLFAFTRERIEKNAAVQVSSFPKGVRIAGWRLNDSFYETVHRTVAAMTSKHTLCLDLRGNEGGDFGCAVRVAELFLPKGTPVCAKQTRAGRATLVSQNSRPARIGKLLVLQDEQTASGAEIIIAALLAHAPLKCETRGARTFGKGLLQTQIQVARGGVLQVTSARIYGPAGEYWHDVGIPPNSKLPPDAVDLNSRG
jgi:carboxyl-terminal processing protease